MDDTEHSGAWTAAPGGGIVPWHSATADAMTADADPDDELLTETPAHVIAALGFDPLAVAAAEWAEVDGLIAADRRDMLDVEALIETAERQGGRDGG